MCQWSFPGKLNYILLYVTDRYLNDYHSLQMLFQLINYKNNIEFIRTSNNIRLIYKIKKIRNYSSLFIQAAQLLRNYYKLYIKKIGIDIILHKILLVGLRLGGRCFNVSTTLVILNQKQEYYLKTNTFMCICLMLGIKISIFIHKHLFFRFGIRKQLIALFLLKRWYFIINFFIKISISKIFKKYQLFQSYSLKHSIYSLFQNLFYNDLKLIKKQMLSSEIGIYFNNLPQYAQMQLIGIGFHIFPEFNNENLAKKIQYISSPWIKSIVARSILISLLYKVFSKHIT